MSVAGRTHWSSRDCWDIGLLVDCRLRVHALLRPDVSQLWVVRGLHEILRRLRRPREVTDEVQMLTIVRRNREGLLHQAVWFIPVSVRAAV